MAGTQENLISRSKNSSKSPCGHSFFGDFIKKIDSGREIYLTRSRNYVRGFNRTKDIYILSGGKIKNSIISQLIDEIEIAVGNFTALRDILLLFILLELIAIVLMVYFWTYTIIIDVVGPLFIILIAPILFFLLKGILLRKYLRVIRTIIEKYNQSDFRKSNVECRIDSKLTALCFIIDYHSDLQDINDKNSEEVFKRKLNYIKNNNLPVGYVVTIEELDREEKKAKEKALEEEKKNNEDAKLKLLKHDFPDVESILD